MYRMKINRWNAFWLGTLVFVLISMISGGCFQDKIWSEYYLVEYL